MQNRPEYCTESRLFNIVSLYKTLLSVYGINPFCRFGCRCRALININFVN